MDNLRVGKPSTAELSKLLPRSSGVPCATCVAEFSTRFSVQDLDSPYWITGEQTIIVDSKQSKTDSAEGLSILHADNLRVA